MLNPLRVAERAFDVGVGVATGAVKAARGLFGGQSSEPQERERPRRPSPPKRSITDTALARKVESELFSDPAVPKGDIDVNGVGRDVYLRGVAKTPEMINELERRAQAIPEVERVENLLHLPKTPAPTRTDTPARQRKTRTTKAKAPTRKRAPAKKVNAERPPDGAATPPDRSEDVGG